MPTNNKEDQPLFNNEVISKEWGSYYSKIVELMGKSEADLSKDNYERMLKNLVFNVSARLILID